MRENVVRLSRLPRLVYLTGARLSTEKPRRCDRAATLALGALFTSLHRAVSAPKGWCVRPVRRSALVEDVRDSEA
jgi:hypothetical protein